jgi:hypothetical protein
MLLDYAALSVALGIPNLQEHLRGSARRRPTRSRIICDVRRACAALLVEQGYAYRTVAHELRCDPSAISYFVRSHANLLASSDTTYTHLVTTVQDVSHSAFLV